jgi:hypothetical protein
MADNPTAPTAPRAESHERKRPHGDNPGEAAAATKEKLSKAADPENSDRQRETRLEMAGRDTARQALPGLTLSSSKDDMTPGLKAGEGPYGALERQHSDWDHGKLLDAAHKIKEHTGRSTFDQGEKFRFNPDGSVTSRKESGGGSFSETRSKDGKKIGSMDHKQEKDGSWSETHYDGDGKKTKDIAHKKNPDGSSTEHERDAQGNTIRSRETRKDKSYSEKTRNPDGSYSSHEYDSKGKEITNQSRTPNDKNQKGKEYSVVGRQEKPDGSFIETRKNQDQSTTIHDQDSKGNYTEKYRDKDGNPTGDRAHTQNPDGSSSDTWHDAKGDVSRTRETRPDGSYSESEKTPEGYTVREGDGKGSYTEKYHDKDGNQTGALVNARQPDGSFKKSWHFGPDGK